GYGRAGASCCDIANLHSALTAAGQMQAMPHLADPQALLQHSPADVDATLLLARTALAQAVGTADDLRGAGRTRTGGSLPFTSRHAVSSASHCDTCNGISQKTRFLKQQET
ncbi:hypothetical protein CFN58_15025, partial [Pseudomonas avellanae]